MIECPFNQTKEEFEAIIEKMYDDLWARVTSLIDESYHWEAEVNYEKYWIVDKNTVNEKAKNPQEIRMKRVMPIDYKFIQGIDLNNPKKPGCS